MTSREKIEIVKKLLRKYKMYNFLNYEFIVEYLQLTREKYEESQKYDMKVHAEIREYLNRLYSWGMLTKRTIGLDIESYADFTKAKKTTVYELKEMYS